MESYHVKRNNLKAQQLGMTPSTARSKLVKAIMFSLLKECKKDICYRCNKPIDNLENLSIEHKKPWLYSDNPQELFFDLDNIAFSHLSCNTKHVRTAFKVRSDTGLKGVTKDKKGNKWRAYITKISDNGIASNRTIGRYDTPEEAGKAYDEEAIKQFGDRAVTNKMLGLLNY